MIRVEIKYKGRVKMVSIETWFDGLQADEFGSHRIAAPRRAGKEEIKQRFDIVFDRILTEFGFE